ncbi:MAG: glucose 1-dehydrogenase [Pirellulales bacterium]|nr:glucose 1-dehydrogenase [Pirellulales bacterium]
MGENGKLRGKRALVTGSGTGIGREIALHFAREGADVALHYAHSSGGAESAVQEIQAMGRKAAAFKADFASDKEPLVLAEKALELLGGIDCLVNNAGITFNKPFMKVSSEQFDWIYNVNVRAPFLLTQAVVEDMLTHGGGAICNITSIHGVQGAPEHSVYAGTKGAIIAQARALSVELAHKGVRINAVAPGCVPVENYQNVLPDYSKDAIDEMAKTSIPVGHTGTPLDIAQLAAFLCSDEARFIIGQTIVADGGTTSLMSLISDFRNESTARFGKGYVPGI